MTDEVIVEHIDGMVIVTINRPEQKNAVNRAVSYGVCQALDEMDHRNDLRIGILTGAGGTFCAGMDLKAFLRGEVTRVKGRGILDAKFGLPEVKRGLAAAAGGLMRLPRLIPQRIAMEIALTGDMISAERLYLYGLINVLTEPGQALEEAKKLARRIMLNAPLSVAASKQVIIEQRDWPLDEMFARQESITGHLLKSADAKEGASAFAEKRAAVWRGE
jgi:enoyl-CoA hydratase